MYACLALFTLLLSGLLNSALAQSPIFTPGNVVVSVEGNGVVGGTGSYGDNQAAPLTLFQFQLNPGSPTSVAAAYVNSVVFPQTASGANLPVSGEYGSSSEGTLQLVGTGQYLSIMGYGVTAATFNANPATYGIPGGELAQSGSLTGQSYTPVPRVVTLIDPYGNVNSSTGLFNIFNGNNPRSTYSADGTHIYVSGQGTSGDTTSGVFYTTLGGSSATTITGVDSGSSSQDTRDVQIFNNTLYVSMDSKSGSNNRSYIGTLGDPPATSVFVCTGVGAGCGTGYGPDGPAEMSGFGNTGGTGKVTITSGSNSNGNSLNNTGLAINISPENFFFASPSVLYVADSGSPKNNSNVDTVCTNDGGSGSVGNGGLQKWVNSQPNGSGTWSLAYTLYNGLNLVLNTACDPGNTDGTTGLIGLTGVVNGSSVELFATNYTIADLDPTYLYGITDTLSFTTTSQASSETFTQLAAAPADSTFKGVSLAPTLPAGSATITTSPSGLAFTSSGTGCAPGTYTTPVTLIWTPNASCQLSVTSPQSANGTQYALAQWQDGTTGTTDTVTAPTSSAVYTASFVAPTSIAITGVSPAAEDYGADSPVTITASLSWSGNGPAPTASDVSIGGNGPSSYGVTSCSAPSGTTMTCTATYTPTTTDAPGSYTETASFSGDSNYSASSSTQTGNFVINQATSTTSVISSQNPSTYAQQVTFTATIDGENGNVKGNVSKRGVKQNAITGTVTWSANTGCSASTVSGYPGVATCTTSSATHLPVGTDTVTATYSGDSNHSGSAGSVSQVVQGGIATSISVTSVSPSSESYGANSPVTITAELTWTGYGTAPTASDVTISGNGNGTYGSTSCAARVGETITCTATYTPTTADVAGSYTETASFSGDTNYAASSSTQTNNFTINPANSTTSISSSGPSNYGQWVTFTATIDAPQVDVKGSVGRRGIKQNAVTGTVTWSANTGCSPSTVSGSPATASCTTSSLPGGTDTVTATYSGDSNNAPSSGSYNQTVNPLSQTVTFTTNAPASAAYNSSFTVAASASSGLTVTYGSSGSCSNSGAIYTMTSGTGPCTVTATQAGNNDYSSASATPQSVNATKLNQSITVTQGAPSTEVYNGTFTINAAASSQLPITFTATGVCSNGGTSTYTMTTGTGTCTVKLSQPGDGNYTAASTITESTIASEATQTITFTGAPASAGYGSTFTVIATSNAPITPFITSNSACSVNGDTVTMNASTGTCTLTATWDGNGNYKLATATQSTTAEVGTSGLNWATPAAITYGTPLSSTQLDATANVAGKFTYSPTSGKYEDAGNITLGVTFKPTNKNYASASTSVTLPVQQASTTTTITSSDATITLSKASKASTAVDFNVTSYKPTGPVTVSASTGETCSANVISGTGDGHCTLDFTTPGARTVTASYGGDANHTGSNSDSQTVTVTVNPY
jgi:hypothetical protein